MNDEERLGEIVRAVLPPAAETRPERDLWPLVVQRARARRRWPWGDVALLAVLLAAVTAVPRWLLWLVYHL